MYAVIAHIGASNSLSGCLEVGFFCAPLYSCTQSDRAVTGKARGRFWGWERRMVSVDVVIVLGVERTYQ